MIKKTIAKKISKLKDIEEGKKIFCSCPTCSKKGTAQALSNFYNMNSDVTKKYPVCKDCIKTKIDATNMKTVYGVLKEMNIAFITSVWASSMVKSPNNPFGKYIATMNSGLAYRNMPFQEVQTQNVDVEGAIDLIVKQEIGNKKTTKVPPELVEFWGNGFEDEEYLRMQKKFDFMKESYPLHTNIHQENLKAYVMPTVKAEIALARNDLVSYKEWNKLSGIASDRAKLNVKQLTKNDLLGGIDCFSDLCSAVEQAVDVISVIPKVRYKPNDSADFIIWQEINYIRDMLGLSEASYEDVYKFYEVKKNNYIKDTGDPYEIFKDDPTEENREAIKNFIKIEDTEEEYE